jgi:ribose 5-phosphate isomerase A
MGSTWRDCLPPYSGAASLAAEGTTWHRTQAGDVDAFIVLVCLRSYSIGSVMADREAEKELAARHAVQYVKDGMRVGLGSGTTSAYAIRLLGDRVRSEGLRITGIATSAASGSLAESAGITIATDLEGFELDLAIDGADQATRAGDLIKGGGGALLHERIVNAAASKFVVILDSSKLVDDLGTFPLPVEVCRFGWRNALNRLKSLGCMPVLRERSGQAFLTEEGNFIIDCKFEIKSTQFPLDLERRIRSIPGVADLGLFLGMADLIIIASGDDVEEITLEQ